MKFSNYLGSIENVSIYPIITIILFMLVFFGAVLWIGTRDKEYVSEMENVPLDNKNDFLNNSENKNESN